MADVLIPSYRELVRLVEATPTPDDADLAAMAQVARRAARAVRVLPRNGQNFPLLRWFESNSPAALRAAWPRVQEAAHRSIPTADRVAERDAAFAVVLGELRAIVASANDNLRAAVNALARGDAFASEEAAETEAACVRLNDALDVVAKLAADPGR
jgi:hypothetical protein